jgi:hypothetical protein
MHKTNTQKTKDRATWTTLKTGGELMCSGRVGSSCSTYNTRRVTLVTNTVKSHECPYSYSKTYLFCASLFGLLSFSWPLNCLSFDVHLLITSNDMLKIYLYSFLTVYYCVFLHALLHLNIYWINASYATNVCLQITQYLQCKVKTFYNMFLYPCKWSELTFFCIALLTQRRKTKGTWLYLLRPSPQC